MINETNNTKFFAQLKMYGIKNFILSCDFVIALLFLVFIFVDKSLKLNIIYSGDTNYVIAIFACASTLFSITLAALAILLSFSNSDFINFLRKNNRLGKLLFLFWVGNGAYLVVLFLSISYLLFNNVVLKEYLYPFIISVFLYGIIDTCYLLAAVVRFGFFIDVFDRIRNDNKI